MVQEGPEAVGARRRSGLTEAPSRGGLLANLGRMRLFALI